jgi:hypothetical protein
MKNHRTTISSAKLELKAQYIYIKPLLKPENAHNKSYFATVDLDENVNIYLSEKTAQRLLFGAYLSFQKITKTFKATLLEGPQKKEIHLQFNNYLCR